MKRDPINLPGGAICGIYTITNTATGQVYVEKTAAAHRGVPRPLEVRQKIAQTLRARNTGARHAG